MSTIISKFGIRGKIDELDNKSPLEIREYFISKGFTPEDDDYDDEPYFDTYCKDNVNKTYPVKDYRSSGWGIEKLFYYEMDGDEKGKTIYSLSTLNKECEILSKEYNIPYENIVVFSYSWYTGCDEPILFKEK